VSIKVKACNFILNVKKFNTVKIKEKTDTIAQTFSSGKSINLFYFIFVSPPPPPSHKFSKNSVHQKDGAIV